MGEQNGDMVERGGGKNGIIEGGETQKSDTMEDGGTEKTDTMEGGGGTKIGHDGRHKPSSQK